MLTCDFCGTTASDEAGAALTWSMGVEHGRVRRFCPRCSREHVRGMEGKLDSDAW